MPIFNNIFGKSKHINKETQATDAKLIDNVWFPFLLVMPEVMPRHHSYIAFNNLGNIIILTLPDYYVSVTKGKLATRARRQNLDSKLSHFDVAFIQENNGNDDASYLVPIAFSQDQKKLLASKFLSCMSRDKIDAKLINTLKDNSIKNLIGNLLTTNADNFKEPQLFQRLQRRRFDGYFKPTNPDDTAHPFAGNIKEIPVFIYTFVEDISILSKDRFYREIAIRKMIETELGTSVANTISQLPKADAWAKRSDLLLTICKVEAELKSINSLLWKAFGAILLNPAFYNFKAPDVEAPFGTFYPLPEGTAAVKQIRHLWEGQTAFATWNWGEPNVMQLICNVGEPNNWGTRKGMMSPAITLFNDEFGIHTQLTHLFVYERGVGQQVDVTGPKHSKDWDTNQIPEIEWIPLGINKPNYWWTHDTIAKKLIWLSVMHLYSHLIEHEVEVIFSAIPIGEDAVQISPSIAPLESGAPYAYLITREENEIRAIPVFTSDTFTFGSDGSLVLNKQIFGMDYAITKDGIRKRDNEIRLCCQPVYISVMTKEYINPKHLSVNKPNS